VSDLAFKVAKRRKDPVTFTLEGDDHEYTFVPPKTADMVLPMLDADDELGAAKAGFGWLDDGLSKEDQDRITARLKDHDDDLDISTLEDIIEALVERVSARPTTSRPA
jgi:hypothetical protein